MNEWIRFVCLFVYVEQPVLFLFAWRDEAPERKLFLSLGRHHSKQKSLTNEPFKYKYFFYHCIHFTCQWNQGFHQVNNSKTNQASCWLTNHHHHHHTTGLSLVFFLLKTTCDHARQDSSQTTKLYHQCTGNEFRFQWWWWWWLIQQS